VCIGLGETIGGFMQGKFLLFRAVNDFMCIKMHHVFWMGLLNCQKLILIVHFTHSNLPRGHCFSLWIIHPIRRAICFYIGK
jgi:hypothetical protein